MPLTSTRLREVRDAILRYCYEHGATMPYFSVDPAKMERDLTLTKEEVSEASMVMLNQGLLPPPRQGIAGMIGLSDRGQEEAERLGPQTMLREPPPPPAINAIGDNSIFQFAGANSVQTATGNWQRNDVQVVLDQIEKAIPTLTLASEQKEQAKGLLTSVRHAIANKLPSAGVAALVASLSSVLDGAGSELGTRLIEALSGSGS